MAYSTFNKQKNDQLKEPMFLGQSVNVARYDQQKFEIFEKLIEKQLSFFWRPEEVDVSSDRIDYNKLPDHEKHIFISNLKYQTLLDSIQAAVQTWHYCLWFLCQNWKLGLRHGHSPRQSTLAHTLTLSVTSLTIRVSCLMTS